MTVVLASAQWQALMFRIVARFLRMCRTMFCFRDSPSDIAGGQLGKKQEKNLDRISRKNAENHKNIELACVCAYVDSCEYGKKSWAMVVVGSIGGINRRNNQT